MRAYLFVLALACLSVVAIALTAPAPHPPNPLWADDPNAAPNLYRVDEGWAKLPPGRKWGAAIGVDVARDGKSVWVFDRCATADDCSGSNLAPIQKFDSTGKLVTSFGAGMFNYPHGLFVDRDDNVWVSDGRIKNGKGNTVMKFSPDGKLLMTLGKPGIAGDGPDTFNGPSDILVAPNGTIFIADGHGGDTNARVVKLSKDGKFIKAWGKKGSGPGEFDTPHSLAMDSAGRLFVADRSNSRIQIFDQEGKFLAEWRQFGRPSGVFIDKKDIIYVADSTSGDTTNRGYKQGIRIGSVKDGKVTVFIPWSETNTLEGVAADDQGNVYGGFTNTLNFRRFVKDASRAQVPAFEPDPLWSEALPNRWTTGQVGGLAVDSHDNVWVFHRPATIPDGEKAASLNPPQAECCIPAPAVLEFDTNGKFLQAWGGPGQGYEWFSSEHGIFVDYKDNVWLSGNAKEDNQILKFTNKGKFLMQIGHAGKNRGSNDTENLGGPAGLFVYRKTNELFVADGYFNHRVIVFDADTGAYKRHWGAYGKRPDDNVKFPPRAQLVQGPPPEGFNNPVHAVVVTNDDLVYVADRSNNRLQVFKLDGTFVKEVFISRNTLQNEGTVHAFAVSPDKEQKFLYVVDGSNKAVRVLNRQTLEIVSSVGGHAGHNAREFFHIHSFAIDSKGNLFLGEVNNGMRYYRYAVR